MTDVPETASSAPDIVNLEDKDDRIDRIKSECSAMVRLLRQLEQQERLLRAQNEILAREALLCGFEPHLLEPPAPKRKKTLMQKQYLQRSNSDVENLTAPEATDAASDARKADDET